MRGREPSGGEERKKNMQPFLDLIFFVEGETGIVLVIALAILLLSLLLHLFQLWQLARLNKRYKRLLGGLSGGKRLEEILLTYFANGQSALAEVKGLKNKYQELEDQVECCVQNLGVVRYNAFPDAAGDLSFALALLDGKGDGVVLSSLYGRNESRIYGKPILRGTSTYHLTAEERTALGKARQKGQ